MIEPSPDALLGGVADSLEQAVLPELTSGPLRRQVREAARIIRRVARMLDHLEPALRADIDDMAATLATLPPAVRVPASAAATGAEADPRARHLALQALVAQADAAAHTLPPGAERDETLERLRDLYRRMLAREQTLGRAPAAR